MIKGSPLIVLALLIDSLQALVSLALAAISTIPGTVLGGAAGCAAGNYFLGQLGCWLGGSVLGFLGTWLNPALATATVPIGLLLGFVVNLCLSAVFGSFLIILMLVFLRKVYLKNLFFGIGELLPGLNNIPFWTAFVIVSLLKHSAEESKGAFAGAAMSPGSALGKAAGGVMRAKDATTTIADRSNAFESPMLPQALRGYKQQQDDLGDYLNQQEIDPGNTPQEQMPARATRSILNDIRPVKTAAAMLLALALAGAGAGHAYAQAVDPLRFVISPEIPEPGQRVTIEAQGVGSFLGDALITWQQDGTTVLSGTGARTFTFSAAGLGKVTHIHVTIQSSTNGTSERDFTFVPSVVHLLWEADTSVPPLYPGKALYSAGSTIKVTALPQVVANGATVSYNNLSFQWKVNGNPVVGQSGKGFSSMTFTGSQLRAAETVSVDVYLGATAAGSASITIPATDPQLLLYIQDPLRGVLYDQALPSTISLLNTEVTLKAQPYYFANESLQSGAASYAWTLGGAAVTGPDSARGLLTLRQAGDGGGEGRLGVELQNTDTTKLVQAARAALRILFNSNSGSASSSFGL